ncbi:MAG: apolipoprotein N-acyltransferase [Victivallales bacterium]|nr:apolipoprotein N-acyltransferase [Victivallales bacterium]
MSVVTAAIPRGLRLFRLLSALLSGVLLATAFAPLGWWWMAIPAFVPLLAAVPPPRLPEQFGTGALFGYGYFACSLHWLNTVGFGAGWMLALYCAVYPALWYCIYSRLVLGALRDTQLPRLLVPWDEIRPGRHVLCGLSAAAAWVALEWIRGWFLTGFPWNQVGIAFANQPQLRMLASVGGIHCLSFLTLLAAYFITAAIQRRDFRQGKAQARCALMLLPALLLLAAAFAVGELLRRNTLAHYSGGEENISVLRVAAIQGNMPVNRFWDDDTFNRYWQVYSTLSLEAMNGCGGNPPDIYLWPEGAMPSVLVYDEYSRRLRGLLSELNAPLLLGTLDERLDREASIASGRIVGNTFNSVFLLNASSRVLYDPLAERTDYYDKIHLVPFGEYVPLRSIFPWLVDLIGMGRDLTPGNSYRLFVLGDEKIAAGVNICFEDVFPEISRRFTLDGAQLLMTVTDDSWYGTSSGAAQHRNHAVMRAVENGRCLMRSGNNSDTCLIDPTGEILEPIVNPEDGSPFATGWHCYNIPVRTRAARLTWYTRSGNIFAVACFLALCGTLAAFHIVWRRRKILLRAAVSK